MARDTGKTTDNAKQFNDSIYESKALDVNAGCILHLACLDCGAINEGSPCLCGGPFDCDRCGKENASGFKKFNFNDIYINKEGISDIKLWSEELNS